MRGFLSVLLCLLVTVQATFVGSVPEEGGETTTKLEEWRRHISRTNELGRDSGDDECRDPPLSKPGMLAVERVIATGASSNHFRSLQNFIASVLHWTNETIVVFDLGLEEVETSQLRTSPRVVYRHANLAAYGPHVASLQVFAWKPVLIDVVLQEVETVLWLDAGCLLHQSTDAAFGMIAHNGAFFTNANSLIIHLTHETMAKRFAAPEFLYYPQVNGGVVGFSRSSAAYDSVLAPWIECALELECIAPRGSSRQNHRQDQSMLSILVRQQHRTTHELTDFGIDVHQDQDAHLEISKPANGSKVQIGETQSRLGFFDVTVNIVCPPDVDHCCLRGVLAVFLDGEEWMRHPEQRFWCRAPVVDQSMTGQYHFRLEDSAGLSVVFSHGQEHVCSAVMQSAGGLQPQAAQSTFVPLFIRDEDVGGG